MAYDVELKDTWDLFLKEYATGDNRLKFLLDFGPDSFLFNVNVKGMNWSEETDESLRTYFWWDINFKDFNGKIFFYIDYSKEETGLLNYEIEGLHLDIPLLKKLDLLYQEFEKDHLQLFA